MHLSSYQINRYRLAQLAPAELLTVDAHLTTCEFCRRQMRVGCDTAAACLSLQAALQATADEEHLAPAQFVAHVNNRLDAIERELFVSHLASCAGCAAQWQLVRQASAAAPPRSFVMDGWEFFRERLAFVWTMPVAATLALLLVSLADRVYFNPKPTASAQQKTAPMPSASLSVAHESPARQTKEERRGKPEPARSR